MNDDLYLLRAHDVAARRLGDELMIMCGRTSQLFNLNETAAILWDAADGETPLSLIVAREICGTFEVDADTALRDARLLALELASHGILRTSGQPLADGLPAQDAA